MASDAEPPRKRMRFTEDEGPNVDSNPILVRVGGTKQAFYVHETLLRDSSNFFNNALKKEWKEGQEAAVDLPDAQPDDFRAWVKFLYTGRVYIGDASVGITPRGPHGIYPEFMKWASYYAFGSFLCDDDFRDALIDAMIDMIRSLEIFPRRLAQFIYPHTIHTSAHRKLAIDNFVNLWSRDRFGTDKEQPVDFLNDVLKAMGPNLAKGIASVKASTWFNGMDPCKYHDHGDKPCYKTKPAFRF